MNSSSQIFPAHGGAFIGITYIYNSMLLDRKNEFDVCRIIKTSVKIKFNLWKLVQKHLKFLLASVLISRGYLKRQ